MAERRLRVTIMARIGTASYFNAANGTKICNADFGTRGMANGVAGVGGVTANSTGNVKYRGEVCAAKAAPVGGGGGSLAGTGANGVNGNKTAPPNGGNGPAGCGNGGSGGAANSNGVGGNQPCGGGGGSGNRTGGTGAGGAGGVGKVVITWSDARVFSMNETEAIPEGSVRTGKATQIISEAIEMVEAIVKTTVTIGGALVKFGNDTLNFAEGSVRRLRAIKILNEVERLNETITGDFEQSRSFMRVEAD